MANNRDKAYRGQTVRLYSYFYENGLLSNPTSPGTVYIHSGTGNALPALSGLTPFNPSQGIYFLEWDIPSDQSPGYYYDVWSGIQLISSASRITREFSFAVLYAPTEDIPIPDEVAALSGLCRVYEFFVSSDGRALQNIAGRASIVDLPYSSSNNAYFVNFEESVENYTDSKGRIDWYLPRGSTVHIEVRAAGFETIKKVPDQESVRINQMVDG